MYENNLGAEGTMDSVTYQERRSENMEQQQFSARYKKDDESSDNDLSPGLSERKRSGEMYQGGIQLAYDATYNLSPGEKKDHNNLLQTLQ